MKIFKIGNQEIACEYNFLTEIIYKKNFGDAIRTDVLNVQKTLKNCGLDIESGKKVNELITEIQNLDAENYTKALNALNTMTEIFIQVIYSSALATKSIHTSYEDFVASIPADELTDDLLNEISEFIKKGIAPKSKGGNQNGSNFR